MARRQPEPSMKDKPLKFEVIYEDEDCISIWKYDKKKFPNGPISVEYKWKSEWTNRLKLIQKQTKESKKKSVKKNETILSKFK
jgi:hypothetical protein